MLSTRPQYTFTFTGEHVYPIYEMNYLFKTDLDDGKITASGNTDANFSLEVMQDPTNSNKGKVLKVFTTNSGTWRTINLYYNNLYLYSRIGYEPNTYYTLNYKVYVENVTGDFSPETSLMVSSPGFSTFLANNNFANANSGVLYKDHYGTLPGMDNLKGVWRDYSITFYSGSYLQHEAGGYGVKEAINNSFQILGTAGFTLYIDDISWTKAVGIEAPASMQFEETSNIHDVYYDENFSFASYYEDEAYDRAIKYGEYSEFKIKDTKTNEYLDEVTVNGVAISADEETGLFGYLATEPLTFTKDYESGDHTTEIVSSAKWPEARTTTDENILLNKKPLIRYGSSLQSGKSFAIFNGRNDLTTGIISGQNMDMHSHYLVENGQMMKFAKADGTYRPIGELYLDITFNLGGVYEFNELWIASNIEKNYYTMGAYEVYISDTQDTLYDNENLYSEFDNHSSCWSGVTKTKFLGTKTGKYLGIRITQGVIEKNWSSSEIESTYARMREIAMLGVKIEDETEYTENSTEVSEISSYEWTDEDTGSVYNILKRKREPKIEYKTSLDKSANNIQGSGELVESIGTKAELTDDILYKNLDMYGHNLKQYNSAGGQYESMFFLKPDGSYRAPGELYVDVTYDLGGEYKLNELWLASEIASNSSYYKLGAFEVYVANDEETLYNENNKMAVFDSHDSIWSGYVKIDFLGEKYGSFLGIRITQGIVNKLSSSPWTAADVDNSYARISEIALFGETTVTSASLAETKITLKKGDTYNLVATAEPATANQVVYWTSSDESVAKVNADGKVTCTGNGTAILTGVLDQFTFTCEVVGQYIPVTDMTLSQTSISAHPKDSIDLNQYITLAPENSTHKELEYFVNNPSVAAVEQETGILTTFAPGNAVITVRSENSVIRTIALNVTYAEATKVNFYLNGSPIYAGVEYEVTAIVEPAGACQDFYITWSKLNGPGNIDEYDNFYSQYEGMTRIGAILTDYQGNTIISDMLIVNTIYNDKVDGVVLDKNEIAIYETGSNVTNLLTAKVYPEGANQDVVWTTSNPNVANVTEYGLVVAVKSGKAVIRATSVANSDIYGECKVIVLPTSENTEIESGAQYRLKHKSYSNKFSGNFVLTPESNSVQENTAVNLSIYDSASQHFNIYHIGNGEYRIKTVETNLALSLYTEKDSSGNFIANELRLISDAPSELSIWYFIKHGEGYYIVNKKHPTKLLQVDTIETDEIAKDYVIVGDESDKWQLSPVVKEVKLNTNKITIEVGSPAYLKATINPPSSEQTVSWQSQGSDTVSVDSKGKISGLKSGITSVSASTIEGVFDICEVTVFEPPKKISFDENEITLVKGEQRALSLKYESESVTGYTIIWSSANNAVAKVNGGMVTALSEGSVKITASVKGVSATCNVTVIDPSTKSATPPKNGAIFRFENVKSGKVLNVSGASPDANTKIVQYTRYDTSKNQKFKVKKTSKGYKIIPMHVTDKVVGLNSNNEVVMLNDNSKNIEKKRWNITPNNDGTYYIVNASEQSKKLTMEGKLEDCDEVKCSNKSTGSKWYLKPYEIKYDNYFDYGMLKRWGDLNGPLTSEEMIAGISYHMQRVQSFYKNISAECYVEISYECNLVYTSKADECDIRVEGDYLDQLYDNCEGHSEQHKNDIVMKDALIAYIKTTKGYDLGKGIVPILWTGHALSGYYNGVKYDNRTDWGLTSAELDFITMFSTGYTKQTPAYPGIVHFTDNKIVLTTLLHEIAHTFNAYDTYCEEDDNDECSNERCDMHSNKKYKSKCLMGNYEKWEEDKDKTFEELIFEDEISTPICKECMEDMRCYLLENF